MQIMMTILVDVPDYNGHPRNLVSEITDAAGTAKCTSGVSLVRNVPFRAKFGDQWYEVRDMPGDLWPRDATPIPEGVVDAITNPSYNYERS